MLNCNQHHGRQRARSLQSRNQLLEKYFSLIVSSLELSQFNTLIIALLIRESLTAKLSFSLYNTSYFDAWQKKLDKELPGSEVTLTFFYQPSPHNDLLPPYKRPL